MNRLLLLGLTAGGLAGCRMTKPPEPLQLETARAGNDTRVTLVAAPGLQVNARLKPALELPGGEVVRFDSPALTPDSAYFAGTPSTLIPGPHTEVHGTLRVSVCNTGASVCRSIVMRI